MATYTPNLNLKKPGTSDNYNIADDNGNVDILDSVIGNLSSLTTTDKTKLVNAINELVTGLGNKLNSSSYTAADVLTKIKTVDGTGSGLDSDTVDGIHFRMNSGKLEYSTDGSTWNGVSSAGAGSFEFGLPII